MGDDKSKNKGPDFIRQIINEELSRGKHHQIITRFPPEPNGYLHIGHAKSIVLNSSIAEDYKGIFNLRFDDTNPVKEETEYVEAIINDVKWLTGRNDFPIYYGSDYFDQIYKWALALIDKGLAYVDEQSPEEIRETRGTPRVPGKDSPFRNRSIEENQLLFKRMTEGEIPEGKAVLRAKIDMNHENIYLRDPVMYRIIQSPHHRQGDKWKVYPMYDFAHGYEDAIEGITHSICTLEFENHRPLYNWFLDNANVPNRPRQVEFAPLNLTYTLLSKRKLIELVKENIVNGWDDPRMPTLSGLRRRGVPAECLRRFCAEIGVSKVLSMVDYEYLNFIVREELNATANRVMAVVDPLKVIITNYPENKTEVFRAENNPSDVAAGFREIPFSRELWIERSDFLEEAPRKFFRLKPGSEVRLKYAYYITCHHVIKDETGNVMELHCSYDPESRGGETPDGRKVKGTLHWVSVPHSKDAEVRLYDQLFSRRNMNVLEEEKEYTDYLNPESLRIIKAKVEAALAECAPFRRFQFLRNGYFISDSKDHKPGAFPVFNRIVGLKDSWAKMKAQEKVH